MLFGNLDLFLLIFSINLTLKLKFKKFFFLNLLKYLNRELHLLTKSKIIFENYILFKLIFVITLKNFKTKSHLEDLNKYFFGLKITF